MTYVIKRNHEFQILTCASGNNVIDINFLYEWFWANNKTSKFYLRILCILLFGTEVALNLLVSSMLGVNCENWREPQSYVLYVEKSSSDFACRSFSFILQVNFWVNSSAVLIEMVNMKELLAKSRKRNVDRHFAFSLQSLSNVPYRKMPIISPGLIFVQKAFLLGLF